MIFWAGLFALAAGLNILVGLSGWPAVLHGSLADPDSYMRLERIRQGIAAGHLTNLVQRVDGGIMVEWSRLLDLLLWLMALPLAPLLGWKNALFAAGVALGPLGVGGLGVGLAFAARPFAEDRYLWAAAAAAALLPGLATFAAPGVVHYHILLLALVAAAAGCTARAWRGFTGFGFLAGLAGGFAIWLTPETMPFVLLSYAALLIGWLNRRIGAAMLACGAGLFDVLGFGFAIDPPAGGYWAAEADRLSLDYLVLGLVVLAGGFALWRLDKRLAGWQRQAAGVSLMAALMLLWIALFPKVLLGPYGIMSRADMRLFFGALTEPRPLHGLAQAMQFLLPGLLALGYALWRAAAARRGVGAWLWVYVAFCTLVTLVLAARFILFVEFPAGIAAALAPVALSEASQRWRARPTGAMLARLAIIAALLLLPDAAALPFGAARPAAGGAFPSCTLRHIGTLLAPYAGVMLLAEPDDTPELLYRSNVKLVGGLYQHAVPSYLLARAAWRSPPGQTEPPAVAATHAGLILFCRHPGRYGLVQDLPAGTLWDALEAGQPPPWLKRRGDDPASGWTLYAVARRDASH